MKKQTRVYNLLFPIWLIWLFPQVLVFVIPGNLLVDCAVLFLALLALKHPQKGAVIKKLWWKFWLLGFAADGVGVAWMFLGWLLAIPFEDFWDDTLRYIMHNPFGHPLAFLWTLAGWPLPGCASTSSTGGPCAPAACSASGRRASPPWPWPSSPPPGCFLSQCIENAQKRTA